MHPEVSNLFRLQGQVALVVGGARHLGRDAASILAAAGAQVAVTSRDLGHAKKAAEELSREYAVDTLGLCLDHTCPHQAAETIAAAAAWRKRLDIAINNAGGIAPGGRRDLLNRDAAGMTAVIESNLTGVLLCCREQARHMLPGRSGVIVNIASIAGMVGRDRRMYKQGGLPEQPLDYAAAKAGVIGLTRDLAASLGPSGIRVNCISPGGFERGQPASFVEAYSSRTPLGRMGRDGEDLKGAILFLASPASAYITGINLAVDGGFTSWQ